jgi:hypothetical protein
MQEPEGAPTPGIAAAPGPASASIGAILAIPAAATLLLGVFPGLIVGIIQDASVLRW